MAELISYDLHATAEVAAPADAVYRIAADITRMGEWSPECTGGRWKSGEPGAVGARFEGDNQARGDTWTTECEVIAAEPGRRFAWEVLTAPALTDNMVWSFEIEPTADGCALTQRFRMKTAPDRLLKIRDSLPPERAATFPEFRRELLQKGMQQTVDQIKAAAEG
ncbi:Polyketide cyclase / dehydrase and lipid transport [Saccharopolyspora kobensis]|uniref:Polyketide cyclase / dehydrase and lipid transport n=1 Tax=Saccharopolyspora kobensis TaxID=146035 RepID=A0A1H6DI09_9PSEU|nr:SRPBCC family protein [Saccharopolyspora kobensis]SEG84870.1 Polyketide cyclase / dehydrase and lipid transport [Saccharopolyspora kobensis]SFD26530.1 Polyketide cyclase / dehydrase and lipid transport [Saccharopolyspora kobensis]